MDFNNALDHKNPQVNFFRLCCHKRAQCWPCSWKASFSLSHLQNKNKNKFIIFCWILTPLLWPGFSPFSSNEHKPPRGHGALRGEVCFRGSLEGILYSLSSWQWLGPPLSLPWGRQHPYALLPWVWTRGTISNPEMGQLLELVSTTEIPGCAGCLNSAL